MDTPGAGGLQEWLDPGTPSLMFPLCVLLLAEALTWLQVLSSAGELGRYQIAWIECDKETATSMA